MSIEKLIEQIVSNRPELSRKELMERLKKAREKTAGFISDESLLRMIAAEFGIEISPKESWAPTLLIGDLVPGLNDVTVIGRVVALFPSKTFKRKRVENLPVCLWWTRVECCGLFCGTISPTS
jgi:ssDNA-binding replication factor A large subunit